MTTDAVDEDLFVNVKKNVVRKVFGEGVSPLDKQF